MSMHAVLQAAAIGGYLFILGLVYGRWRLTSVHRAFLLFLWSALGWALATFFLALPISQGHEPLAKQIAAVFWIPLNFWVLRFTYLMVERRRDAIYYILAVLSGLSLAIYLGTDLAITGFERYHWGVAAVRGPLHLPISLTSAACALTALGLMLVGWKRGTGQAQRKPLALMAIGSALAILGAFGANLVLPVFLGLTGFPELGSYAVFVISPFLYLAVVRYGFLSFHDPDVAEELFLKAPDGILLVDAGGRINQCNTAGRDMLGMHGSADGRHIDEVLPPVDRTTSGAEHLTIGHGRHQRVLQITRIPQVRYGSDVGEILVLRDVTDQIRAEQVLRKSHDKLRRQVKQRTAELEQAQKMEAIGTIAGGFAHDFNNILAAIVGFATASKSDLPDRHRVQGDLDEILLAANRGRGIVKQLMSFTRRRSPHRSVIDGFHAVEEVVKLVEVSAPQNVSVHFIGRASHAVQADPAQLHQVLLNLATNAFQALALRGGNLTLEVDVAELQAGAQFEGFQRLPAGKYLRITVADDGPGMRPEVLRRAFEPFFTTKPDDEGTGLGLATARRIVKEHGGAIGLETAPGQGCIAHIYLPCVEGVVHSEQQQLPDASAGTERLWVIDDAEQVTRAAQRMLEPLGYNVRTFTDPRDALEVYRNAPHNVDLVLLDHAMPHLSGAALAASMLALRPELPILLVTGCVLAEQRELAEQVGIRSVLFKPLERSVLAAVVRHQLDAQTSIPGATDPSAAPASRDVA